MQKKCKLINEKSLLIIQRDLGIALGNAPELQTALNICLEALFKIDEIDCAGIYLVNPDNGDIYLADFKNLPPWFVKSASYYERDSPQVQLAMQQKPIFSSYNNILKSFDLDKQQIIKKQKSGVKAFGMIPIIHKNNVIGVINVGSKKADNFQEFTKCALKAIAFQVAGIFSTIQANQALKESQNNLKTLFENLNDFLFVLDGSGKIIEFNPVVKDRLGYSEYELITMNALDLHPPNRREEAQQIIADMLAGKRSNCPIPLSAKDGREIPVETIVTLGVWNHKSAIFGISRDITQRLEAEERNKKALKEKEILLREIHHRVKNNMQIISSLLRLQANKSNDQNAIKALEQAESRIHSMTLVHEILYQSDNLSNIDFQLYLEKLILHLSNLFAANKNLRIIINAHNTILRMEQIISCGLIVTELVSNSFKYAFNSNESGLIKVGFQKNDSLSTHKQYKLSIYDSGRGLPKNFEWEKAKTLGLRLVKELVNRQLEGRLTLVKKEQGICWVIEWNG